MNGIGLTTALAAVAGLGGAAFFVGAAPWPRSRGLTAVACAVGASLAGPWLQVGPGWTVAALAVGAASALSWERTAGRLIHLACPVWALGALAVYREVVARWGVFAALGALTLASLPWLLLGWRTRSKRDRGWFVDLALLGLIGAISLLAAPAAFLAWRRAGIAAEGQDALSTPALPLWPLALGAGALLAGLLWTLHRSRLPSSTKGI